MTTALTHVKQFISAGFDMAQWGVRRNAIPYGPTGTIAQNNSAELSRIFTVKTADVSVPEADVVPITGDDGLRGSFLFASNQPISFTMEVGESDLRLASKSQGTSIYEVGPYWALNVLGPDNPTYEDIVLLMTSQAKAVETNQEGSGFHHVMLPYCNIFYLGAGFNERGEKTFRYSVTTSKTSKWPWGQVIDENIVGTGKFLAMEWFSQNRFTMATYISNGVATQFTLARTPVDPQHCLGWRNGAALPITVVPSTRVASWTGAGTGGDEIVVAYEYA